MNSAVPGFFSVSRSLTSLKKAAAPETSAESGSSPFPSRPPAILVPPVYADRDSVDHRVAA
jgi:hypothetical protein